MRRKWARIPSNYNSNAKRVDGAVQMVMHVSVAQSTACWMRQTLIRSATQCAMRDVLLTAFDRGYLGDIISRRTHREAHMPKRRCVDSMLKENALNAATLLSQKDM